jgi:hypothetical protein
VKKGTVPRVLALRGTVPFFTLATVLRARGRAHAIRPISPIGPIPFLQEETK